MSRDEFVLKHKDIEVAYITLDIDYGVVTNACILCPEHMPFQAVDADGLTAWWQARAVPETQDYLKEKLVEYHINNHKLLSVNLGLSLNDAYWISPIGYDIRYRDINLYENEFREELEFVDYDRLDLSGISPFFAGSSLQGNLKKKWIRTDGNTILVKGSYKGNRQSIGERVATIIYNCQEKDQKIFPHVQYSLADVRFGENIELGVACPNFTDINTEFITARDIFWHFGVKSYSEMTIDRFVELAPKIGLDADKVRDFLEYQALVDFLITNTDRHLRNYGVLRDADTLDFIGMAPIFDSGSCLFFDEEYTGHPFVIDGVKINSPERTEERLLSKIHNKNLVDISKLPDRDELIEIFVKNGQENVAVPVVDTIYSKARIIGR